MSKTPAKPAVKEAAPKKAARPAKPSVKLPVLVEAMYTLPPLIILGVDLIVIGFSYTSGADWVSILVRACVTTLGLGSLMLLIASLVSSGALASAMEMRQKAEEQAKIDDSPSIEA
jgi:hypothetical protein